MKYKIEFLSDWHCGSGLSSGSDVDALVIKDKSGLPYVPGKTLKGLLSEAARTLSAYKKEDSWSDFVVRCFGLGSKKNIAGSDDVKEARDESQQACTYFSNAELSEKVKLALEKEEGQKAHLYRKISSTKIDNKGLAVDHSLRKVEVTIPLTVFAEISGLTEEDKSKILDCFKWIKRLGTNRNRGLGRCVITEVKGA